MKPDTTGDPASAERVQGLELAGGHRFGNLRDPDFAVNGGHGWFFTMGVRFTEKLLPTAGDFWRDRFGQPP